MTGVERAEQAVTEAQERLIGYALVALPNEVASEKAEELADALLRAVEACCAARLRAEIVREVHAEPLPTFPAGEDPALVARTVRSMDLRAIQNGGTSDLLI